MAVPEDRCVCGYPRRYHEGRTQRCPGLKTGAFRDPPPVDMADWREIMARDAAARFAEIEASRRPHVPEVVPPPQVPARPVAAPAELAGYQGKQAVGLGRRAVAAGWSAAAFYWRGHNGGEGCAVKLSRGPLRVVATWARKPGQVGKLSGWSADLAYAWRVDVERFPTKITYTELERIMFDVEDMSA